MRRGVRCPGDGDNASGARWAGLRRQSEEGEVVGRNRKRGHHYAEEGEYIYDYAEEAEAEGMN